MESTASASASGGAAITSARGEVNTQGQLGQAVVLGMEEWSTPCWAAKNRMRFIKNIIHKHCRPQRWQAQAFSKCCSGKGSGSRSSKVSPEQDVNDLLRGLWWMEIGWGIYNAQDLTQSDDMTLQWRILVFWRFERFWGRSEGLG